MRILRYRADLRSVSFLLLVLCLMAIQWLGLVRHPSLFVVTLLFAFFACVINHNHQHCPTFLSPLLNCVFGCLLSVAIGQPATAIVPMHNLNHHVHNNTERDFVRSSLVQFRWNLLNLLLFPAITVCGYARVKSKEMSRLSRTTAKLHRQLFAERTTFYVLLAALLVARPLETALYLACPYVFGQWAILAINLVQHDGCRTRSEYDHSRNFVGRWLNWWVLNNGYHTAHHLRPGLHWSLLPEFHATIRHRINPRLECRSLLRTLASFYLWPARRPGNVANGV